MLTGSEWGPDSHRRPAIAGLGAHREVEISFRGVPVSEDVWLRVREWANCLDASCRVVVEPCVMKDSVVTPRAGSARGDGSPDRVRARVFVDTPQSLGVSYAGPCAESAVVGALLRALEMTGCPRQPAKFGEDA